MSRMLTPPHPGETLREDVLPALGLTVTDAAAQLGVTRAALSHVLNVRAAISTMMALRLEGWLGLENGGHADDGWCSKPPMTSGKQRRQFNTQRYKAPPQHKRVCRPLLRPDEQRTPSPPGGGTQQKVAREVCA